MADNVSSLTIRFGSVGQGQVLADMTRVRDAGRDASAAAQRNAADYVRWWQNALAREDAAWLAAKDARAKVLADIARIQAKAYEEELRQRNAALAAQTRSEQQALRAEQQLLREWTRAKEQHEREKTNIQNIQSKARQERARQEADAIAQAQAQAQAREAASLAAQARAEQQAFKAEQQLLREWLRAKDQHEREKTNIQNIQSKARQERARQEADAIAQAQAREAAAMRQAQAQVDATRRLWDSAITSTSTGAVTAASNTRSFTDSLAIAATAANQSMMVIDRWGNSLLSFVKNAAVWEAMDVALTTIEGSAKKAAAATAELYEIAKAPGIDLRGGQMMYLQMRAIGIEGGNATRVIKEFANTIALTGGSGEQLDRVRRQMLDMMATGRVYQKDLRIMQEAMPRLATLMQQAFGTTSAEGIRKLGIDSVGFIKGILVEMEKLPRAAQTLNSELENSEVAWSRFKAAFVNTQFTQEALRNWTSLLENMTEVVKKEAATWPVALVGEDKGKAMGTPWGAIAKEAASQIPHPLNPFSDASWKERLASGTPYGGISAAAHMAGWVSGGGIQNAAKLNALSGVEKLIEQRNQLEKELQGTDETETKRIQELTQRINDVKEEIQNYQRETRMAAYEADFQKRQSQGTGEGWGTEKEPPEDKKAKASAEKQKALQQELDDFLAGLDSKETAEEKHYRKNLALAQGNKALIEDVEKVHSLKMKAIADEKQKAIDEAIQKEYEAEGRILDAKQIAIEARRKAEIDEHNEEVKRNNERARELEVSMMSENEKLRLDYEEKRRIILEATNMTGEQRNALNEKLNREYLRQENEIWLQREVALTASSSSLFGALAETARQGIGESSKTYKALFAVSKSFAMAESSIKLSSALMKALDNPWPANMAAVAEVAAAGAGLISNINSTAFSGVFDKGGYIPAGKFGIAGENGAEIITGPANVVSTRDTAAILGGKAPNVTIHNYSGVPATSRTNDDGSIEVLIGRVAAKVEKSIAGGIRSGGGSVDAAMRDVYGVRR